MHLIAADTAFQLARERRERLQLDFPRQPVAGSAAVPR